MTPVTMRASQWIASFAIAMGLAACGFAQRTSYERPGESVSDYKRLYVAQDEGYTWDTGALIVDRLKAAGRDVRGGPRSEMPEDVDLVVTYEDHWFWDMSMYMISVKVDFRDAETNALVATGQSLRTSLKREDPEYMVDEAIAPLLASGASVAGGKR